METSTASGMFTRIMTRAAAQQLSITKYQAGTMLRKLGHCLTMKDPDQLCGITVSKIRSRHDLELLELGIRTKLALDQQ